MTGGAAAVDQMLLNCLKINIIIAEEGKVVK